MEKYIINSNTLILIQENNKTKAVEKFITYIINRKVIDIIDESCKNYGSSFEGRCQSSNYLLGVKYKCPIIISETKEIIIFPTKSFKNDDCVWINLKAIDNYCSISPTKTMVNLINNCKFEINTSSRIISNQILKSSRLESILKSKNG